MLQKANAPGAVTPQRALTSPTYQEVEMAANFKACSVDGCNKPHYGNGWCVAHNAKWRKYGDPLHYERTPKGEPQKFIERAVSYVGDDCLIWPFARSDGYARINIDGRVVVVSGYVCERVHGPRPFPKAEAAHSCGNGNLGCINPHHLSWKTKKGNMEDMVAHGRSQRGVKQWNTKLTPDDVLAIRALKGSLSQSQIGQRYGVDGETIGSIHREETWAWL